MDGERTVTLDKIVNIDLDSSAEAMAYKHIQTYHLINGRYKLLLDWSTPVEEVAAMQRTGICQHSVDSIY